MLVLVFLSNFKEWEVNKVDFVKVDSTVVAVFQLKQDPGLEAEAQALKAFKNSIFNDPSSALLDWNDTNHHCNWSGIACDPLSGNVVSVALVDKQLAGEISPFLGNLTYLQVLDLTLNSFTGRIPPQLGSCSQLTQLILYANSLSGSIPAELGNLKNLQSMDLGDNFLNGSIPESLCNCTALIELGFINNNLTGTIPLDIGNLVNLQLFVAFGNKLEGSIPASIGKLKELQAFDLSVNQLTGKVPPEIGNMSNLEILQLHVNLLSGEIPPELGYCRKLVRLNIFSNHFTGSIPSELGNLVNLEVLRLYKNKLDSTIPNSLFQLKSLTHLGLSENELVGTISSEIGSLRSLEVLTLHSNNFSGEIPSSITQLSNLSYLSIGFNSFTGPLPTDIGLLYNLMNLTANDNLLEGSIPSSIINCTRLLVITLTRNRISGKIPQGFGQLSNLTYMSLGNNRISGNIPDDLFNCSQLEVLDLSQNNLNGPVPRELSKLTVLQGLSLNDNELDGVIPEELSELKQLSELRLQHNNLVGPIPDAISELESLSYLDLSGNKLNGTFPKSLQRLLRLTTLDLSHNHITGYIPGSVIAAMKNMQIYLNVSHNILDGTIPEEIGMLEMVQGIDMSNNNLSGSIPLSLRGCRNLISLDLSGNRISGQVPGEIFPRLSQLVSLNLSRNQLDGALPETLGSLRYLTMVDLSQNKFNGTIPESFANILSLKYLNLSFNLLEGHVPEAGVFKNMTSTSLQGNPALCGTNYLKHCEKKSNGKSFHHFSKKALVILLALGCVLLLIILLSAFYAIRQIIKNRNRRVGNPKLEYPSAITLKRFDAKDIATATNSFSQDNIIGSSTLSTVYKGTLEDGKKIAVKNLNLHQFAAESDKFFYREVNTLGQIRHKNLVKVLGYAWESGSLKALVLEFMENGNLEKIIHDPHTDHPRWPLAERIDALISIANALVYLHSGYDFPIVHCDLKPSNVLLDGKLEAHVSDFGTARILGIHLDDGASISSSSAFEGTIGYLAPAFSCKTSYEKYAVVSYVPEFAYMRKVTTKVDVFSFGIIVMELITKTRPTGLMDKDGLPITLSQLVQQALQQGINRLYEILDPHLKSYDSKKQEALEGLLHLALSCTSPDPDDRPDMEQINKPDPSAGHYATIEGNSGLHEPSQFTNPKLNVVQKQLTSKSKCADLNGTFLSQFKVVQSTTNLSASFRSSGPSTNTFPSKLITASYIKIKKSASFFSLLFGTSQEQITSSTDQCDYQDCIFQTINVFLNFRLVFLRWDTGEQLFFNL
ncbi:UNVERIFIED_CONTAM: LRR receptor-like serine/threonine-protein kinase FLS2 [Sesamum radiatum]|uniref:LRR receptor-like serine/threonine-protein kinase FLS2 n=1 Tax=Sesamum radiatum TaxID=300843 RepID=A0AAW2LR58_SESRA